MTHQPGVPMSGPTSAYVSSLAQNNPPPNSSASMGIPGAHPAMASAPTGYPRPSLQTNPGFSEARLLNDNRIARDFFSVVKKGNLGEIHAFISEYNLDITKIVDDNFRHTCLFYAALIPDGEQSVQVMKAFIDRGVPATYTDILNQTVLYYASREGKLACVDLLVKCGCKANHKDQYGQTPLFYASREGHCEVALKLIHYGADVNVEDQNGQTSLFYSAREGKKDMCALLLKHEASVNKQDKKKQTALRWAKKFNRQEVIQLLLEHGATPLKDSAVERSTPKASSSKKKEDQKDTPKRYVLTVFKDGKWRQLTPEEMQNFLATNKEVSEILHNPEKLGTMRLPPVSSSATIYDHWDKAAKRIMNHLWKSQGAWHFHQPVDPVALRIPDYPNIIRHPMDFGTIKSKLSSCAYSSCAEFVADVETVFSNCIQYNGEKSDFGVLAGNLREIFKKQCQVYSLDYYM